VCPPYECPTSTRSSPHPSIAAHTTSAQVSKLAVLSSIGKSIATASWPACWSSGVNRSQHHAPCQAPCTSANVAMRVMLGVDDRSEVRKVTNPRNGQADGKAPIAKGLPPLPFELGCRHIPPRMARNGFRVRASKPPRTAQVRGPVAWPCHPCPPRRATRAAGLLRCRMWAMTSADTRAQDEAIVVAVGLSVLLLPGIVSPNHVV
jgi:hypothetical protein